MQRRAPGAGLAPATLAQALVALVTLAGLAALPARAQGLWPTGCEAPNWALAAGAVHSRWQEHADNGRRLVDEQGTLGSLDLRGRAACGRLRWQADVGLAQGRRGYDGVSSTGQAVATHSSIRQLQWRLAALLPLQPAPGMAAPAWQAGLELGQGLLWRDIASTATVRGYPERFTQWHAAALLAHARPLADGLALQATLALGGGPAGRLRLHLPIADAATLRLGGSTLARVALGVRPAAAGGSVASGWQLQLHWQLQRTGAGPAATLRQGGLPVGGAAQPAFRQQQLGLQAGWRF